MARTLDTEFIARYARPPADTTVRTAISLHENVREILGDSDYLTFLQGSYKNDTALANMNDVDIVALVRQAPTSSWSGTNWEAIFSAIEARLRGDYRYAGKWKRHDKCITLSTSVNIDIVPAVPTGSAETDPIEI